MNGLEHGSCFGMSATLPRRSPGPSFDSSSAWSDSVSLSADDARRPPFQLQRYMPRCAAPPRATICYPLQFGGRLVDVARPAVGNLAKIVRHRSRRQAHAHDLEPEGGLFVEQTLQGLLLGGEAWCSRRPQIGETSSA